MKTWSHSLETGWALVWAFSQFQSENCTHETIRSSDANTVFRLGCGKESLVLKVGPDLEREYLKLRWLNNRVPAPQPIGFHSNDGVDALLMSAIDGDDLAELCAKLPACEIVHKLSAALHAVHAANIADWQFGGSGGVLVHGDACLPNFLFRGEEFAGCIDVGGLALGDIEVDLAAAVWSLQYNLGPGHGLPFLREYGITDADEDLVERLRLMYELGS